jgi:hypothetical protein
MALDSGYSEDEAKQYAYGNSSEYDTTISGVGSTGQTNGTGINYADINVPAPTTGQPITTGPSAPTTPAAPKTPTTTNASTNVKIPAITGGAISATTPWFTTPTTTNTPTAAAPAVDRTITDLTPGLTKGSAFKFADSPTFTSEMINVPQQNPYDYTQQILNAATGGSIEDLKPGLVRGSQFSFAHKPEFKADLIPQQAQPQTPTDYTQQILNAAAGGVIHGYNSGGQTPQTPEAPSPTLRPGFLRGHQLRPMGGFQGVNFSGYQPQKFAMGGDVQEHNPQFFSVGGLNSLENTYVKGEGDGTSDEVPAMLANGEFVIPADVVSKLGNGSNDAGANVLDEFLSTIRQHAQNHDPKKLPPTSKGPLAYLLDAKRKVG